MNFYIWIHLCGYHQITIKSISDPQKYSLCHFSVHIATLRSPPLQPLSLLVLPVQELHMSGMTRLCSNLWLTSFIHCESLRFIHVATCISGLFLLPPRMDMHSFLTCSPTDGHLCCVHFAIWWKRLWWTFLYVSFAICMHSSLLTLYLELGFLHHGAGVYF